MQSILGPVSYATDRPKNCEHDDCDWPRSKGHHLHFLAFKFVFDYLLIRSARKEGELQFRFSPAVFLCSKCNFRV
jgi:hypothetical protein